jgi:hypothetical protein
MDTQKSIVQTIKETLIIIKRNIFHLAYFVLTALVIGFIYATWMQDNNYTATGSVIITQTITDAQRETIVTSIHSSEFAELVATELNQEYTTLPNGKALDSTYVSAGISASYTTNSPTIVITFSSPFQDLTLETVNTAIDQFVTYGNTKHTFVNNTIRVSSTATAATFNGQSPLVIYGAALVLGIAIGSAVIVYTDFRSGKILFVSDLENYGYRAYEIKKVKSSKDKTELSTNQITDNILNLQNNLESNIIGRYLKTIAFVSFDYSTGNDDFIDLMAKTYAANNQKTLIVDLDLIKPTLSAKYGFSNKNNIVDISEQEEKQITYEQIEPNLFFLAAKEINYTSRFFKGDKFKTTIDLITKDFDIVLFRLSLVEDDMTSLGALDKFDFVVASVVINKTSKNKIRRYLESIKKYNYDNIVFNALD